MRKKVVVHKKTKRVLEERFPSARQIPTELLRSTPSITEHSAPGLIGCTFNAGYSVSMSPTNFFALTIIKYQVEGERTMPETAVICQLHIERFRGIEDLRWNPVTGVNIILGGGDVGKTTILEAIALLLSRSNNIELTEADYWRRDTENGFAITAVIKLPPGSAIGQQAKFSWPWEWNGKDAVPPVCTDDIPTAEHPVYRIRVSGSPELEANWEILQPNEEADPLSLTVRREIGLVRLSSDDRNDRDLRLVYGSALNRLLADKGLRARVAQNLAELDLQNSLSEDARKALTSLDDTLAKNALPHKLELGLTGGPGLSIGALTGLFAEHSEDVKLPMASWGTGTRRMATLHIAAATESTTRILVVDEIERGLETYRVRKLVASLQADPAQSFATTHSAIVIGVAKKSALWYLDPAGEIGLLSQEKVGNLQERDPEAFLARFSVICEGCTEVGFLSYLLDAAIDGSYRDHGIRLADGMGNEPSLEVLEAMADVRLRFAGFVDNEGLKPSRWAALKERMGDLLFQWEKGCLEENIIKMVPEDQLIELITNEDGEYDGDRLRTLADRLKCKDKDYPSLQSQMTKHNTNFRKLIIAAATGATDGAPEERSKRKEWKSHAKKWFKTEAGGRELASKAVKLNLWPKLRPHFLPFFNEIRQAVGQDPVENVTYER